MKSMALAIAAFAGLGLAGTAQAADLLSPEPVMETPAAPAEDFFISEVRAGIMAHDAYPVWLPTTPSDFRLNQIEDIGFDVLFRSPDWFYWIGSPRPNLGGTINLDGQESMAHLALTWQVHLFDSPVYLEASAGGAIHNGILQGTFAGPGSLRPQGCRVGFYTEAGIGVDVTDSVTATLSYEHMSNDELCSPNYGLSNVGIKLGAKF